MEATNSGKSLKPWRQQIVKSRWNQGGNIILEKRRTVLKNGDMFSYSTCYLHFVLYILDSQILSLDRVQWHRRTNLSHLSCVVRIKHGELQRFAPLDDSATSNKAQPMTVCPAQWQFLPGRLVHPNHKSVLCLSFEVLSATWCVGKNRKK